MLSRISLLLLCLTLTFSHTVTANPEPGTTESSEVTSLSYSDAIILGIIEGITEYLPVSSTGHLILTNAFLGLDAETAIRDDNGDFILVEDGDGAPARPYTIGEAAYAYVIVIQAGAIAAVVLLYWQTILKILLGCLGKSAQGRKLAINLICAFIPAAVIGLILNDWIEATLGDNVRAVAAALIVGAIVMLIVEKWRKHGQKTAITPEDGPAIHELSIPQCIMIGFFQCVAMWPGTSRSMATIVGGYIAGLSPKNAAEFSFLLGLITLSAASGYKIVSDGSNMISALDLGPVLLGCVVAFISSALAVKWLVTYLSKHGLTLFAWYRIALAIAVFLILGR
ncbi:undecaprenyl-diphosphate phosphatase [Coraliomargarita sp. SDUM461004]|uniref:Undecaprenyl-diphosphatase n=1 Tax=Thalassobacterium sedimentorum TaxID=3041258 RepID=A0ABU1AE86_9BACT|nr:undecaprenyl-diphosphate phosphatase [Coraliomargarita sp. SDUM461004]MDQ8193051.1 undecaprenyl-diphosphate phosphatase [Coraliomargarita sp. SDUM461004]